ncbi:MAG: response regulator [Bacteroidales bacterium]|nr:response regulator [Bacteroidales bacterium]
MYDTIKTIRWYFKNTIQVWALLCLLTAGGIFLYNYLLDTLTIDRVILIILIAIGLWIGGKTILTATRKEVEKEIEHLLEYEQILENEITTNDLMQFIPIPAMLIEFNKHAVIKDANIAMANILVKKVEELVDCKLEDLRIPTNDITRALVEKDKVENIRITINQNSYLVWGKIHQVREHRKAMLLFVPIFYTGEGMMLTTFDNSFFDNFSHDIFDAINVIMGFTNLLEDETIETEKKQYYLQILSQNVRKLNWLLSNYVQMHYKESYSFRSATDVENLNFLLDEIHQRIIKDIPNLIETAELKINKPYENEEAFLIIDNHLIYQLFLNLIMFLYDNDNQIKITISYSLNPTNVRFIIKVYYHFPSAPNISYIIETIESKKSIISHPRELNLHLFKKIISRIGGKIEVFSPDKESLGIHFTVPGQATTVKKDEIQNPISLFDKTILSEKNILIVEDIEYNRMLLKEYLTDTGANLHFASTGKEAIDFCRKFPNTDIILLDIQLPDTDGYQIINELKRLCPNVIIIAQTAYHSAYDKKKALEAGFNYYLSKPLKQDILLKALTKAVHKHLN